MLTWPGTVVVCAVVTSAAKNIQLLTVIAASVLIQYMSAGGGCVKTVFLQRAGHARGLRR